MALVNLDNPNTNPLKVPKQSKWEVSTIQWNPRLECSHKFSTAVSIQSSEYFSTIYLKSFYLFKKI